MTKKSMDSVKTTGVGFAPILKNYFEKCGIKKIIDDNIDHDPRRKGLTHGQACIAMITSIMFQTMQLYKICQFANRTTILDVILPGIAPCEYFDDRLADTLDALFDFGIGDLELLLTRPMISQFNIAADINHYDTYKHAQSGRPARGAKKIAVIEDHFTVTHTFNKDAFDQAVSYCGYYPLITNEAEESLSIYEAMTAYKKQYKVEHTNRRAKSSYNIEPIYLQPRNVSKPFYFYSR